MNAKASDHKPLVAGETAAPDLLADNERVQAGDECPHCRESRIDMLAWNENGTRVRCLACGERYAPSPHSVKARAAIAKPKA